MWQVGQLGWQSLAGRPNPICAPGFKYRRRADHYYHNGKRNRARKIPWGFAGWSYLRHLHLSLSEVRMGNGQIKPGDRQKVTQVYYVDLLPSAYQSYAP